jgi:hypothetical protein
MTEAAAKQQLLNDIEKLDQHSGHDLIDILRCCIDPSRRLADKPHWAGTKTESSGNRLVRH